VGAAVDVALIFATLGELICERAGVLNLGIEGIMTVGAFAGWSLSARRRSLARVPWQRWSARRSVCCTVHVKASLSKM
jgi:ABC-type uncharacterized transport system permease subunit